MFEFKKQKIGSVRSLEIDVLCLSSLHDKHNINQISLIKEVMHSLTRFFYSGDSNADIALLHDNIRTHII